MQHIELLIKIVPHRTESIIGWKGDVLEVGLERDDPALLCEFLSKNLGVPLDYIFCDKGKIYTVTLTVKHLEYPVVLLT